MLKEKIYSFIKEVVFKKLGLAITGFKGWLASIGFNWVYDNLLTPVYTWIETEIIIYFRAKKIKKEVKRVQDATTKEELRDSFRDLLSKHNEL